MKYQWTRDVPTIPGYYWFQLNHDSHPFIVEVKEIRYSDELYQYNLGYFNDDWVTAFRQVWDFCRWAGPIQEAE